MDFYIIARFFSLSLFCDSQMRMKGERTAKNLSVSGIKKNQTGINLAVQMCDGLIESSAVLLSSSRTEKKKNKSKKKERLVCKQGLTRQQQRPEGPAAENATAN